MNIEDKVTAEPAGLFAVRQFIETGTLRRGIGPTLGISGTQADLGRVVLTGSPNEDHYNPYGTVHGGYISTMLDSAITLAVQTTLGGGMGCTTTDLKIAFLRPVTGASGPLRCEGGVLNRGRRLVLGEARLWDAQDRLCAHATGTCMLVDGAQGAT